MISFLVIRFIFVYTRENFCLNGSVDQLKNINIVDLYENYVLYVKQF